MDTHLLERKFESMGARLKLRTLEGRVARNILVDVRRDRKGEYFDVGVNADVVRGVEVLDVRPKERHLLLMARETQPGERTERKNKFLCGHDERAWFVAAVPGQSASTVPTAMEALKPSVVRASQVRNGVRYDDRNRRKNRGFVRQGEWFFVPGRVYVPEGQIRRNEPMQRSGGKAHWAEFAFRTGGERVYVSARYPRGIGYEQYRSIIGEKPELVHAFRAMTRNATLYVRGRISHPDHKTIELRDWHRVMMNTEHESPAMRHVVFLD